jgi:hypothetical protein
VTGRQDELARPPRREEVGLVLDGWLLYPSAFAGVMYDTNPQQRSTRAKSSPGLRLVPSLLAQYADGIHKTSVYGFADGRLYTSAGGADALTAKSAPSTAPSPNGATYTGTVRGGFFVLPDLYAYLEGSGDSRNFATRTLSSSGYRAVGGLGSDQIGLFKGEVYGGFQTEAFSSTIGTTSGTTFGGRAYYYPLPELTVDAFLDRAIGVTLLASAPESAAGASARVTTALTRATYIIRSPRSGRLVRLQGECPTAVRKPHGLLFGYRGRDKDRVHRAWGDPIFADRGNGRLESARVVDGSERYLNMRKSRRK